jgi:hypothetical protein
MNNKLTFQSNQEHIGYRLVTDVELVIYVVVMNHDIESEAKQRCDTTWRNFGAAIANGWAKKCGEPGIDALGSTAKARGVSA